MDKYGYTLLLPRTTHGMTDRKLIISVNGNECVYDIGMYEVSPELIFDDGDRVNVKLIDYINGDTCTNEFDFVASDKIATGINGKISIVVVRLI